jgi:hypothetical protein
MHVRARDRAAGTRNPELQPGVSYLHSIGRCNTLFGRTPDEVMKGCVRTEDGEPVIFPIS